MKRSKTSSSLTRTFNQRFSDSIERIQRNKRQNAAVREARHASKRSEVQSGLSHKTAADIHLELSYMPATFQDEVDEEGLNEVRVDEMVEINFER